MTGNIIQISTSLGGIPKRPVRDAVLTRLGLEGDRHAHPRFHGGPEKAVLLIDAAVVDELAGRGYPVFYGAMGENLTVRGLDRRELRAGQQFRAGGALIELSKIRVPCATLETLRSGLGREIYDAQVKAGDPASPRWAMSGFYARVIQPGPISTEDIITLVAITA